MKKKETRENIIRAGRKAVDELIKVAEEKIITHTEDDVSADRLKNAAATKKLCIMDAFEIFHRISGLLYQQQMNRLNEARLKRINTGKDKNTLKN